MITMTIMRITMIAAMAAILTGMTACREKSQEPARDSSAQPTPPAAEKTVTAAPAEPSDAFPERPELPAELQSQAQREATGQQPRTADTNELPVRLSALMDMGGTAMAGLVDVAGGGEATVQQGNIFRGYTVKSINLNTGIVTLEKQGKTYELKQSGDPRTLTAAPVSPLIGNTNVPAVFTNPDLRNIPVEQFEPTQDEIARGINPNDSSTWPKGYKGPAIERFLAKMSPEERAASERPGITPEMMKAANVEPTEEEAAQGIDPNDHTTWPKGYKGPAIEDYLAEHPEEAAKMLDAEANPPVAPKLEGYEATPEEAARGINPNDPATWPADYRGPGIEDAMKATEAQKTPAQ